MLIGFVISCLYCLFLIFAFLKDEELGITIIVYAMLAVPYSTYNTLLERLTLMEIAGFSVNIPVVTSIVFLTYEFFKHRRICVRIGFLCLCALFVSYFLGLSASADLILALKDYYKFGLQIMWGIGFYLYVYGSTKFDLNRWMDICFNALTINCAIFIVGRLMNWAIIYDSTVSGKTEEVGMWASNCLIFVFGFFGYKVVDIKNRRTKYKVCIKIAICVIYLIFFQKSRIAFAFAAVALFLGFIIKAISEKNINAVKRNIVLSVLLFIAIPFIYMFMTNSNIFIFRRLLSTNLVSTSDTMLTRIYTFIYYGKKILQSPVRGYGFGELLLLVNQYRRLYFTNSYYTDNAFLNVGMKSGLLAVVCFSLLWVIPIVESYRNGKKNSNMKILSIAFFLFIIGVSMFCSQINHNYIVSFYAVCNAIVLFYINDRISIQM